MEKEQNTIVVQCYPYGELIYIVKSLTELDNLQNLTSEAIRVNRLSQLNGMDVSNMKETKMNGTTLNNWKWNYLYDNITNKNNLQNHTKTSTDSGNESGPGHSFFTDFDEFTISLMKKEMAEYPDLDIKETDLLENDDSERLMEIKETSLTGSDDEDIKETDLTGTDDEFTDVSSLSSLTISNGYSLNRLDSSFLSIPRDVLESKSDIFGSNDLLNLDETKTPEDEKDNPKKRESLLKFQDLESDYFETDCETMDSGIFPHKETEYFQDIGSDFFDDEEEDENVSGKETSLRPKLEKKLKTKGKDMGDNTPTSLSPVSPLPPGKTATMSNSLLRSTICELERALGDSNKLLAKRDAKMQVIRTRNMELKKTLSKEIESNTKMKHLLIEKDKIILEKQTKIIALNQEIHEINNKLAKLRLSKVNEVQTPENLNDKCTIVNETSHSIPCSNNDALVSKPPETPEKEEVTSAPSTPVCKTSRRSSCKRKTSASVEEQETKSNNVEYFPHKEESSMNNDCKNDKEEHKKDDTEKVTNGELQANLRIKFLRDAFFYYMIGFHPDEQINAILAILEYGDRRQDFVLEAHNMKKNGKKFNVSKVSSRGHSFVQEEFQ